MFSDFLSSAAYTIHTESMRYFSNSAAVLGEAKFTLTLFSIVLLDKPVLASRSVLTTSASFNFLSWMNRSSSFCSSILYFSCHGIISCSTLLWNCCRKRISSIGVSGASVFSGVSWAEETLAGIHRETIANSTDHLFRFNMLMGKWDVFIIFLFDCYIGIIWEKLKAKFWGWRIGVG